MCHLSPFQLSDGGVGIAVPYLFVDEDMGWEMPKFEFSLSKIRVYLKMVFVFS